MAYLPVGERPAAAGFSHTIVTSVFAFVAARRKARVERRDLNDMLRLSDRQLDDIGLSRQDLLAAFGAVQPTRRDPFDIAD